MRLSRNQGVLEWQEFCLTILAMTKSNISSGGWLYLLIILFFVVPYLYFYPSPNAYWVLILAGIGLALLLLRIFKGHD
jgi:hypothetical protein